MTKRLRKLQRNKEHHPVEVATMNQEEIHEIADAYERTFGGRPKDGILKKIAKSTRNEMYSILQVPCAHSLKDTDQRVANFRT